MTTSISSSLLTPCIATSKRKHLVMNNSYYRLLLGESFSFIDLTISNAAFKPRFVFSKYMCENSLLAWPLIVLAWIPWLIVLPYDCISVCPTPYACA